MPDKAHYCRRTMAAETRTVDGGTRNIPSPLVSKYTTLAQPTPKSILQETMYRPGLSAYKKIHQKVKQIQKVN